MTVSTTIIKNFHNGNGSATNFAYQFRILQDTDLLVIIRTNSTGAETTKTLSTHYTVAGAGDASGGSITFTAGNIPASGETVVIRRNVPQTQAIDYIANDPFPAETHEEGLDRGTMVAQQVAEESDRSIKLSRTNTMNSTEFTVGATDRANKILAFDSSGEISVTQELGTFKGSDATTTTAAYVQRDIIKSTTAAQLNNVYICVADSVVGDLLTDTDHFELLVDAVSAATSATAAANSASAAATSETNAATSETNAATSETNAQTAQTGAETAETNAETAETNAETSETNAAASETAAATSETNAATSESNASTSASTATTQASNASNSASAASTSETNASNSASAASTSETNAATSATNAATSESNASTSATTASTQATNASTSATNAATSESNASTSEINAATSATTATTQATNASNSATTATTQATNASTSATNAATSETNAATSATTATTKASEASTSATNAATSETNASNSETAAAQSATDAANSADAFDDVYLGSKSSDPTTDNDGDALAAGMLYYNTVSNIMRIYSGSAWENVAVSTSGFATLAGVETLTNKTLTSPKINEDVVVTSTATELNLLDGVSGLVQADFTKLAAIDASAAEIDTLDGLSRGSIIYGNASAATAILTKGTVGQVLTSDGTDISWSDVAGGTDWQSSIKTSAFTAVANEGYWINTTSAAVTMTLPASASVGDTIEFSDYLRTWGTNAVTINTNSLNFQGNTSPNPEYNTNGQSVRIVYSGATQGWIPTSDDDVTIETPQFSGTADFLVIAGGGGGGADRGAGGGAGGYRNSYNSETSGGGGSSESSLTLSQGTTYTITVGGGGAGQVISTPISVAGTDSSITGSDITNIVSSGGGRGGNTSSPNQAGGAGGSGGGGHTNSAPNSGGSGTANQGFNGETGAGGGSNQAGGGGGAGEAGGTDGAGYGGDGLSSSITGSAVARGGGGGGHIETSAPPGGTGGGGSGGANVPNTNGTAGTANTGGGGGAGYGSGQNGFAGGSGVVILRVPTFEYSGTTTGSPTVTTSGDDTILTFNASGSYTP